MPLLQHVALQRQGGKHDRGVLGSLPVLKDMLACEVPASDSTSCGRLPILTSPITVGKKHARCQRTSASCRRPTLQAEGESHKVVGAKRKWTKVDGDRSPKVPFAWRTNARDDLPVLGKMFGTDLQEVPLAWLDIDHAKSLVEASHIQLPCHDGSLRNWDVHRKEPMDVWEVFGGSANATAAFIDPATGGGCAGPPVDLKRMQTRWRGLPGWNVLLASCRQLIWATLVVMAPLWVHSAPPCRFWSIASRRVKKRSPVEEENLRLEALVFIVLSVQSCKFQIRMGRFCSLEQPKTARSWHLDIINELLQMSAMRRFPFDSCPWGHVDPGNHLLYKKPQCFASNGDMSSLCLKCKCNSPHQAVEGCLKGGVRHGARRSVVAGEYPVQFCNAWVALIKHHVGRRRQ